MAVNLRAVISADASGFYSALRGVESMGRRVGTQLRSYFLSAFSVQAMTRAVRSTIEHVREIDRLAYKYKLTAEQVQRLQHYAKTTRKELDGILSNADELAEAITEIGKSDPAVILEQEQLDTIRQADETMQRLADTIYIKVAQGIEYLTDKYAEWAVVLEKINREHGSFKNAFLSNLEKDLRSRFNLTTGSWLDLGLSKVIGGMKDEIPTAPTVEPTAVPAPTPFQGPPYPGKGASWQLPYQPQKLPFPKEYDYEDPRFGIPLQLQELWVELENELVAKRWAATTGSPLKDVMDIKRPSDALSRIGGFVGGAGGDRALAEMQRMNRHLSNIVSALTSRGIVVKEMQ